MTYVYRLFMLVYVLLPILCLLMFTHEYSCLPKFATVCSFLSVYSCLPMFTCVYLCLLGLDNLFTHVYSCLAMFTRETYVYHSLPHVYHSLSYVYHCLLVLIYICLPIFTRLMFTYFHTCLPLLTRFKLWLLMFTYV